MLSLLLAVSIAATEPRLDPIHSIPMTDYFFNDPTIRADMADLLRRGGFDHGNLEAAAFLIREEGGNYRCQLWPFSGHYRRQKFDGLIPQGTVAIVHTHPVNLPDPSRQDRQTATRLNAPLFVLTRLSITLITVRGEEVVVVRNQLWWKVSASSSSRCSAPDSRASRLQAD